MHDISRCDSNALEGVGNLLAGRCRTDQRWERRHDAQGAWSHCGCAIQMLLVVLMVVVVVSSYPRVVCASVPSIPFPISHPPSSAQLSSASSQPSSSSTSRSPCISPSNIPFPAPVAPFLPPSADRLEPFETARGGERYPGWWFGGDRATRGREGLGKERWME